MVMENYAAIKARLVAKADLAVIGIDDHISRAIADEAIKAGKPTIRVCVTTTAVEDEAIVLDGTCLLRLVSGRATRVADLSGIASLRGKHNGQNAAAAVAALGPLGLDLERVAKGLRSFPGCRIVLRRLDGKERFFSSTTQKRPTPMPPKRRCFPSTGCFGLSAAEQKRRHRTAAAFVWQSGQGLSDWRGERAFRADNRGVLSLCVLWLARRCGSGGGARRRSERARGSCRTAFASLRVFRSIPRFRKTWRSLS